MATTSNYPTAVDTFDTSMTATTPLSAPSHHEVHLQLADALLKIETELGTTPSSASYATVAAAVLDMTPKSTFDANTVLKADTDNTPVALTVPASTFVGRASTGNIVALTVAQALTELGLSTAAADILTNAGNITTNTTNIATNTAGIATNVTNIATNVTNIATNTAGIATNVTNIATNAAGILANTALIGTNTTNIATNAANVATNSTNITTNATNIAANTVALGTKVDSVTDSASIDFTLAGTDITAVVLPAGVDHDVLANFVANEHIDHTSVSITAGTGLSGGGDISASRTLQLNAATSDLTDTPAALGTAGQVLQVNAGGTALEYVTPASSESTTVSDSASINMTLAGTDVSGAVIPGGVDHDLLLNFVANEHIDHTAVSITAGTGLTGGGDISVSRTINLNANAEDLLDVPAMGTAGQILAVNAGATALEYVAAPVGESTTVADTGSIDMSLTGTTVSAAVIPGGVDHDQLFNYAADRHIAHTNVNIIAGTGLTGGGDITTDRTLTLNANITDLLDTPAALGTSGQVLTVNAGATAVEWTTQTGSTLAALTDVNVAGVANGSGLIYNSTTSQWEVGSISGASLAGLTDTSIAGPTAGQVVAFDGVSWVNTNASSIIDHDALTNFVANEHIDHSTVSILPGTGLTGGGDLTADRTLTLAGIDGHTDVDTTTTAPNANEVLAWDGTNWVPAAPVQFGEFIGNFDASAGAFPTTTNKGNWYTTSVAGTVDGQAFNVGDILIAAVDNPSTATFAANWTVSPVPAATTVSDTASINLTLTGTDITGAVLPAGVDHDLLLNFVANEHIDHSAVSILPGTGLSGGGDLTADRTLTLNASITNLTDTPAALGTAGQTLVVNAGATALEWGNNDGTLVGDTASLDLILTGTTITGNVLPAGVDHDSLLNFVANEHIDHSAVSITAGTGLTGGGDLTATRTLTLNANIADLLDVPAMGTAGQILQVNAGASALEYINQSAIDHDTLTNFVANEHVDHSAVSILAGTGLTGGGDLTADRTLTLNATVLNLTDTPAAYGTAGQVLAMNAGATAMEFVSVGSSFAGLSDTPGALGTAGQIVQVNAGGTALEFINQSAIDHDALTNFVANEHIDHTAVTLTAGTGLSGGGDISANRTFNLDATILQLTDTPAAYGTAGQVLAMNAGATAMEFVDAANFTFNDTASVDMVTTGSVITANVLPAGVDHDALANFVANEHIDHSTVTMTAGNGLTGGGTIAATRTFTVLPDPASHNNLTVSAAGVLAPDEVIEDTAALTGAAPTGAQFGVNTATGDLFYVTGGNWAAVPASANTFNDTASVDMVTTGSVITANVLPAGVDHDQLLNFVANEHIDHTTVTMTAGNGLTGGGTIAATRTLTVLADPAAQNSLTVSAAGVLVPHVSFIDSAAATVGTTGGTVFTLDDSLTIGALGHIPANELGVSAMASSAGALAATTTAHLRAVIASTSSAATGATSAVISALNSTASGDTSLVSHGSGNTAGGDRSIAGGINQNVTGREGTAFGFQNTVSGQFGAFAGGALSTSSGDVSTTFGISNTASGIYSTATGNTTTASGANALSVNSNTVASGNNAVAAGVTTIAQAEGSLTIGQFNVAQGNSTTAASSDHIFIVGNGASAAARSNAYAIRQDGVTQHTQTQLAAASTTQVGNDTQLNASATTNLTGGGLALMENTAGADDFDLWFYNGTDHGWTSISAPLQAQMWETNGALGASNFEWSEGGSVAIGGLNARAFGIPTGMTMIMESLVVGCRAGGGTIEVYTGDYSGANFTATGLTATCAGGAGGESTGNSVTITGPAMIAIRTTAATGGNDGVATLYYRLKG